ncbi:MAG: GTPase ObgE [Chloroflexota bacterium]|nr:GTPase ObgE [Chloroflexota bacterium]
MFQDHARITVRAGNGGDGSMHMRREKYAALGGPDGGDGGRGGSVYLEGDPSQNTLLSFRHRRNYAATSGTGGGRRNCHGKAGDDLVIKVPLGTIVREFHTGADIADIVEPRQRVMVARGGKGGLGNTHFKTSVRQAPDFAQRGEPGEEREIALELRLIADVGLVGYPNAGKSSFLAAVTAAQPKVAAYPFTTLEPILGVVAMDDDGFILADIPGLIEGASEGAGLGLQFLRHVARTRLLLHVVDLADTDCRGDAIADVDRINAELASYAADLATRPQLVLANKMDTPEAQAAWPRFRAEMNRRGVRCFPISAAGREGLDAVVRATAARLSELRTEEEATKRAALHSFATEGSFARYEPAPAMPDRSFRLEATPEGFLVSGDAVDRLVAMIDVGLVATQPYLRQRLRQLGITEALLAAGVRTGDTVYLAHERIRWGPPEAPPRRRTALARKTGAG